MEKNKLLGFVLGSVLCFSSPAFSADAVSPTIPANTPLLAPAASITPAPSPAQTAAQPADELLLMSPVVYGVSKSEESMNDVPMSVYVVTREDMQRWGVRELDDLFNRVPGFSFYNTDYYGQYGPIGRGQQSVWRFGMSYELMPIVDFGHLTFAPNFFKSIEVARGPAGLMWGSGAEAGLINMNIRDDLEGLETMAQYGNQDREVGEVLYGGKFQDQKPGDGFFVGFHAEHQDAQGENNTTAFPNQAWQENGVNLAYTLLGKIQYKDFKFIIDEDYSNHVAPVLWYGNSANGGAPVLQKALEQFQNNVHDEMDVLAYRMEYHLYDTKDFGLYVFGNYYKKQWWTESVAVDTQMNRSLGFNGNANFFAERLHLDFGGDFWGDQTITDPSFTSYWAYTNYGINWYDSSSTPSIPQSFLTRDAYLQAKFAILDNLKLILGGRADYQAFAQPTEWIFSPRAGLIYEPVQMATFKYLYNSTNRRPQANEIAPGISYETLQAHELIALLKPMDKLNVNVTVFYQELSNQITRNNNPNALNSFINTGGSTCKGLEWDAKYTPLEDLLVYWNGSFDSDHVKVVTDGTVDPHNSADEEMFVPLVTTFVGAEYNILKWIKANLDVRLIDDIPYFTSTPSESSASVAFVDLTLRKEQVIKGLDLSLIFLNLLDNQTPVPAYGEHAGNAPGTLEPEGRRFYLQASMHW